MSLRNYNLPSFEQSLETILCNQQGNFIKEFGTCSSCGRDVDLTTEASCIVSPHSQFLICPVCRFNIEHARQGR